jgi:transglutaminase-like putative cysteine protease
MMQRFQRMLLSADALGILLVVLSLQAATQGITSSLRDTNTNYFLLISFGAALIAFSMGKFQWTGIQASVGIVSLGTLLVWILGAHLTQPILMLVRTVVTSIPKVISTSPNVSTMDTSSIIESWNAIIQSSSGLISRIQTWLSTSGQGLTSDDILIRNLAWMFVLWLCAAWMGWFTRKRDAFTSLSPSLLVLAVVTSYSEKNSHYVWLVVVFLLLLTGIWNYRNHINNWESQHIDYSEGIQIDIGQSVLFITIAIATLAFSIPSVSWQEFIETFREGRNNNTAEILGIQTPEPGGHSPDSQGPTLPRSHLLSGSAANSEEIVMTVSTGELPPIPNESLISAVPRYYWRNIVYDQYIGTGWATSPVSAQDVSADTTFVAALPNQYRKLHMDVKYSDPSNRLIWSGILLTVDVPITARWRVEPSFDLFADQSALLQSDIFAASINAESYRVDAYIPMPAVSELRSSSTEYPQPIRSRYLTLPASLPERVHQLAREITDGFSTPYDKAVAIEAYLRTNYPYDLKVPPPPQGRDVADFLLFDLQRGYCDYYATTMVVLVRSVDIPARFVSGYSPGSYDAPSAQYIVRELNAHSWVEVYFPEIGWIEFEPTASLPEIERIEEALSPSGDEDNGESFLYLPIMFELNSLWILLMFGLVALATAYMVFMERWLVLRLAPNNAIEKIYQAFYRAGRPHAGEWTHAETSTEFLAKLHNRLDEIKARPGYVKYFEKIKRHAAVLTNIYHLSLFVDHQTNNFDVLTAWRTWVSLRRQLFFARLMVLMVRLNL